MSEIGISMVIGQDVILVFEPLEVGRFRGILRDATALYCRLRGAAQAGDRVRRGHPGAMPAPHRVSAGRPPVAGQRIRLRLMDGCDRSSDGRHAAVAGKATRYRAGVQGFET
ncbi:hypothetical protein [Amycolatopsis thermoflava]|uniref:hypothetical protein n=1 Tax=Amycolatopsis thermoflava TaxID=84480 RepID=UPI001ADF4470|nr:hypothetical protein [Amycolatopsis thermoflava]